MAAHQPDHKNLSVVNPGVSRVDVLAELGMPIVSDVDLQGNKVDLFKFKQGFGKGNKASRALFHGTADLFTLGAGKLLARLLRLFLVGTKLR